MGNVKLQYAEYLDLTEDIPPSQQRESTEAGAPPRLSPLIGFNIGRWVNVSAPEFPDIARYNNQLARANNAMTINEEGEEVPRTKIDKERTSVALPEHLHILDIYFVDSTDLIMRAFANDRGQVHKPNKVKDLLRRTQGQFDVWVDQQSRRIQEEIQKDSGRRRGKRSRVLDEDEIEEQGTLACNNGIFEVEERMEAFGKGNVFGLVFKGTSDAFLQAGRARSLDFISGKLGVYPDGDLSDRILSRTHHTTMIRNGIRDPARSSIIYPQGDGVQRPQTFVTDYDPKMRVITP